MVDTNTQSLEQTTEQAAQNIPIIVKVKPGSSSEKGVTYLLPADKMNLSVDELVNYSMGRDDTRRNERVINRLKTEMSKEYGVTINGQKPSSNKDIVTYLSPVKKLDDGSQYRELEIIIASEKEGGYRR